MGGAAIPMLQSTVNFNEVRVSQEFEHSVVFLAHIQSEIELDTIYLFIQPEGGSTDLQTVNTSGNGEVAYEYNLQDSAIRPFSKVDYWYRVVLKSGLQVDSQHYSFDYIDNRFDWQTLSDNTFIVHWYDRELAFGQYALNTANTGIQSAQAYLPVDLNAPLDVYIYNSISDLQPALHDKESTWVAGHAAPDLGIVMVSIPTGPEQNLELERQLPHEIAHILQYQIIQGSFEQVPVWLLEGTATLSELYPNAEYQRILENAVQNQSLESIQSLCTTFPQDTAGVYLAYAESSSFVRFLHQKYGNERLLELLKSYQAGIGCPDAVQNVYGASLDQLDYRWQQEYLGVDKERLAAENLAPYLILFIIVLAPVIFTLLVQRTQPKHA
jgi:hypothetical protein